MRSRQVISAKFKSIIAWMVLLSAAGCGGGGGGSTPQTNPTSAPKYTVMVYMVGSDLESGKDKNLPIGGDNGGGSASLDLAEMGNVGSTTDLNIIVQTGGAKRWLIPQISNTSVQRWRVTNTGMDLRKDLGNVSMGDPQTLQDFIEWTMANYPADKYTLVMWDHGGGAIGGFGSDENNGGAKLSLPQIRQALQNAYNVTGKTFEVIGYDACLMATLEVAHNMSPYGKYLVASEETEPGHGWDFTTLLQAIANNPGIDGASLGKVIADGYKAQAETWGNTARAAGKAYNFDKAITLSVVDLSKVSLVTTSLGTFADAVGTKLQSIGTDAFIQVAKGRSTSEEYGTNKAEGTFYDMTDLKNLASNLQATYPAETAALANSITQAVIYKVGGSAKPNANGLSVFLPHNYLNTPDISSLLSAYNTIDFSTSYKNMVSTYVTTGNGDQTPPVYTANTAMSGQTISTTVSGGDVESAYAMLAVNLDPSTVLIIGTDTADIGINGSLSYTWTGQWLTLNDKSISAFVVNRDGNLITLDIPAKLNGLLVDILVLLDTGTQEYVVLGAWPGSENGLADKNMLPIASGDVIIPQFLTYNDTTGWGSADGETITVGSSIALGITSLPAGFYSLGFLVIDYSQNGAVSQFVTVSSPPVSPSFRAAALDKGSTGIPEGFKASIGEKIKEIRNHR